ncbi:MAG: type II toxin-antitoxin system HicA family toxin [Planctomycetaceae bacterium]|jgi:predicted RNA binding protein YcfA (HicA-like mRNA interferase family)|nr:type II toxin-antitoxin system HicA family toxin [Planctomycetaceae bacterium]
MTEKHRKTLKAVFADPVRANLAWKDVEAMLKGLGAEVTEGRGSRVRVALRGVRAVFHQPHPGRQIGKGMVRALREFLGNAGIGPDPG